ARGALVTDVTPGSPAEKAGIIRGDVIRTVNGYEVKDTLALVNRIAEADVGSNLTIDLVRDGENKTVVAKVTEQPADFKTAMNRSQDEDQDSTEPGQNSIFSGVQVENLNPQNRARANVPSNVNGVIVTRIDPNANAAQQLRPGDVIEQINREPIANVDDFQNIIGQLDPNRPVIVGVARDRQRSFVLIQPD
ncbi:MAG TPA: PDZ domain-containing protein, partial [Chthoniobacterales bacterium]|nr:PDZ domain-containing protein [Chthoniobacterales bacterium]